MQKNAFLFPGQGAQTVGMFTDLINNYNIVRETFEEAEDVLRMPIRKICAEGPVEELNKTENTQPCVFTCEIAAYRLLIENGVNPELLFGFSLGECAAVVAGGSISFADGLRFIAVRAHAMQEAVPQGKGGMLAVIGQNEDTVAQLCADSGEGIWMANYNCPKQIVCSGYAEAIETAERLAAERGIAAQKLNVSVPSHCPLMQPAAEKISEFFDNITFQDSGIPILRSSDGEKTTDGEALRDLLISHLTSPVRCELCLSKLAGSGITAAFEVGPGTVLSKFLRKIDSGIERFSLQNVSDFDKIRRLID